MSLPGGRKIRADNENIVVDTPPSLIIVKEDEDGRPSVNNPSEDPDYTYKDIESAIIEAYLPTGENRSSICDILATYCRGQKILYTEAKTHCEQRLNFFMLPSILVSVSSSIVNLALKDSANGELISACMSGFVAFILALINHMKLDGRAEAHRTSAHKFDKLQSRIEFNSGKNLFDAKAHEGFGKFLETIETEVQEIRETNNYVLPESIRRAFPKLYGLNVFARVKQIGNNESMIYEDLKDIMNTLKHKKHVLATLGGVDAALSKDIEDLDKKRNVYIKHILAMQNQYIQMEQEYKDEIDAYMNRCTRWLDPVAFMKV